MLFFIAACLYVLLLISINVYHAKHENRDDFLIGSRTLSALPLAISLGSSWLSGGLLVMVLVFVTIDMASLLFLTLGVIANLLALSLLVKPLYAKAREHNWITMTEMSRGLIGQRTASLVMLMVPTVFFSWLLFELVGGGLILSELTPLTYIQSVLLLIGVISVYLFFGGFKSLIRSDLIQYGFMAATVLALIFMLIDAPAIEFKSYFSDTSVYNLKSFLAGFFGYFFLQACESTLWQRVLAAKSAEHAQRALLYTIGFHLLNYTVITLFIIVGLAHAPGLADASLFARLANEVLPPWLGALFLVAILAIMMSTLDTVLFISAQCFSTDVANVLGRHMTQPMRATRIAIVIVVIAAALLSFKFKNIESIFWFILAFWVALTPIIHMYLPSKTPSDTSVALSIFLLAVVVTMLYLTSRYHTHYVFYVGTAGLCLPILFDMFRGKTTKTQASA